jgi:TRAP-type C4-dicarboxylate transport system permease small subunit
VYEKIRGGVGALQKICDWIEELEKKALFLLLTVIVISLFLQVFNRFVLKTSLGWTQEMAIYSLFWMVMIGVSIGIRRQSHLVVDFLILRLPESLRYYYVISVNITMILILLILIYQGVIFTWKDGLRVISVGIAIKMIYVYVSIPLCSAISILYIVENIIFFKKRGEG